MRKYLVNLSIAWLFLPILLQAQPVEVISPDLRGASQPQVAVAPDKDIFVAFGKGDRVYCASSLNGARTFLPAAEVARLPQLALGMRRGPRIVASDKQIVISAISQQSGNLYAWTSADAGRTWSKSVRVNSVPNAAREGLHGMAGDQGNVYAVWLDARNGQAQLWGAGSRDGGRTWGNNVKIYQSPDSHICECCHPSVEIGNSGSVRVMWRNWLGGSRDMYTATSRDGGTTFGVATKLGVGTWPLNACPMDGGGLAGNYSVWRRDSTVYYTDGAGRESALGPGIQPIVALGKQGPYFVWEQGPLLLVKTMYAAPFVLSQNGSYPAMAVASHDESPVVVWESTKNGVNTILAQALE